MVWFVPKINKFGSIKMSETLKYENIKVQTDSIQQRPLSHSLQVIRKVNEILKNYNHNYEWFELNKNQLLKKIYDPDYHLNFSSRGELKFYQNQSEYFCWVAKL